MTESLIPRTQVSLAPHTVWHIGGVAQYFFQPKNLAHLQAYLASRDPEEPLHLLGLGSNVLVPDEGLLGSVIVLTPGLSLCTPLTGTQVRFEAGVTCAKAARFTEKLGLMGGAFWAGIPGTIGGALAMNAGCFGGTTWEQVVCVETLDRAGNLHQRLVNEYEIGYRSVLPKRDEIFVAATFEFLTQLPDNSLKPTRTLLQQRNATQPIGQRSCGSVFKNPPGDFAARLIEAAGLKGEREGGAVVSVKHANFIINDNQATAADVLTLMKRIQKCVFERFQVQLEPEVMMLQNAKGFLHD